LGDCLLWAVFLEIDRSTQPKYRGRFFNDKGYVLTSTKIGWDILRAIFSQAHLVTLKESRRMFAGRVNKGLTVFFIL
jgi:hypothetical protein